MKRNAKNVGLVRQKMTKEQIILAKIEGCRKQLIEVLMELQEIQRRVEEWKEQEKN